MPGAEDRRDRKEATRLFIAAAIALLLIVIGAAGLYYFTGWMGAPDPFSAGLRLKDAAVIAFGVSLVVILIMPLSPAATRFSASCPSPSPAF